MDGPRGQAGRRLKQIMAGRGMHATVAPAARLWLLIRTPAVASARGPRSRVRFAHGWRDSAAIGGGPSRHDSRPDQTNPQAPPGADALFSALAAIPWSGLCVTALSCSPPVRHRPVPVSRGWRTTIRARVCWTGSTNAAGDGMPGAMSVPDSPYRPGWRIRAGVEHAWMWWTHGR
jgi:hypothetical protein